MIIRVSRTPCYWSHTWRMLKFPEWSLRGWGHPWHHGSSLYLIFYLWAKFQLSSILWGHWRFLMKSLRMRSSLTLWIIITFGKFSCVPNFTSLAWLEGYQEPPSPCSHTWRSLMVPDGVLEDGVIFDILDYLHRPLWSYPEIFLKIWLNFYDLWGVKILARTDRRTDGHTNGRTYSTTYLGKS